MARCFHIFHIRDDLLHGLLQTLVIGLKHLSCGDLNHSLKLVVFYSDLVLVTGYLVEPRS